MSEFGICAGHDGVHTTFFYFTKILGPILTVYTVFVCKLWFFYGTWWWSIKNIPAPARSRHFSGSVTVDSNTLYVTAYCSLAISPLPLRHIVGVSCHLPLFLCPFPLQLEDSWHLLTCPLDLTFYFYKFVLKVVSVYVIMDHHQAV